jgi:competence protein ComEA
MRQRRVPEVVRDGTAGLIALYLTAAIGLLARAGSAPDEARGVVVEVRGDVVAPGMYLVDPPTLAAAVEAAGGPWMADAGGPVRDGDVVEVGPAGPRVVGPEVAGGEPILAAVVEVGPVAATPGGSSEAGRGAAAGGGAGGGGAGGGGALQGVLDLNAADAAELDSLPGIGPSLAAAILADRAANGPFPSVDALDRVKGIGPATVERLRGRVVVGR